MANYGITVDTGGRRRSRADPLPFMNDTEAMKAALASMRGGVRALGASIQGASRGLERMERACGGVVAALMDARGEIYEKTAHAVIDTDGMDPSDIAEELILSYL